MAGKLAKKWGQPLTAFLVSGLMTLVVSGVSTIFSLGFVSGLVGIWMGAWGLSWAIAFPTLLAVLPVVRKFVAQLTEA